MNLSESEHIGGVGLSLSPALSELVHACGESRHA